MATTVYALYCFEVLSASLEHTASMSLSQAEVYWSQYLVEQSKLSAQRSIPIAFKEKYLGISDVSPLNPAVADIHSHFNASSPNNSTGSSTPSATSNTSSSISMSSSQSSLHSGSPDSCNQRKSELAKHTQYPMFITWNVMDRNGSKTLRGCIGTFEAQPLDHGLKTYALTSAFEDNRFRPISTSELSSLECAVTLLTDFEPALSPLDWELGKHGIRISFSYHSRRYSATYLPDVAIEQGWDKTETMVSLMRKAGWNGKRDEWMKVQDLTVVRYQGLKVDATYGDWRTWRNWASRPAQTPSDVA